MKIIRGFKNSWVLINDKIIKTNLIIKDGRIEKIGNIECSGLIELDDSKIIVPGFIDQHVHGSNGSDIMDATKNALNNIACSLAKEGITAFLATTTTQSDVNIEKTLISIKEYINEDNKLGSKVLGIHLEGPFINEKYKGAQLEEYITKPNLNKFKHYEKISGNNIRVVSLAPEIEDGVNLIKYLKTKNINISLGHTNASYDDVRKAINEGANSVTHTYNGMRSIHHREIGIAGSSLLFNELFCEIIVDGIHVSIPALQLLFKNKPSDKIILITDALRYKNMPDGKYNELGNQIIIVKNGEARLEDGTLAGSTLKINDAIKNTMNFLGTSFEETIKYVTENPAKNLGVFHEMGSIEEGKFANLVIVDKNLNVYKTIRQGRIIYSNK